LLNLADAALQKAKLQHALKLIAVVRYRRLQQRIPETL